MTRTAMMGVGLALGLAIGCAAARFVVPPVRAGTNPQKWEYSCFQEHTAESVVQDANKAGAEGWEMVVGSASSGRFLWCFKRALP
jgi:hypothetical protein